MPSQKFRVYLAGPISGCNPTQLHKWRDEVKQKYGNSLDFIDPSHLREDSSYQIVKNDIDSIEAADGLLVNMWRESIGSAIGIVHAHRAGRPVVLADPNHLNSAVLKFYAAAIEETPLKAANVLLHILRADANWRVIKSGGRDDEPFQRDKLAGSIRAVCRSARRNDIVVPALVLPKALEHLVKSDRKSQKQLTTGTINEAVTASLAELEANADYASEVKGVAAKWQRRRELKRPQLRSAQAKRRAPLDSPAETDVEVYSGKSHSTIWGNAVKDLSDIPSADARRAFHTITQVSGITRIILRQFNSKESRADLAVVVNPSKQNNIIEGKIYDKGVKGSLQTFQVRVQHASEKQRIFADIINELKGAGCWGG